MTQILKIFAFGFILLSFVASNAHAETKECTNTLSIASVDGMVCDFCAQSISKQLKKDENVKDVVVDLEAKTVTVSTKNGAMFKDEDLAKAIDYAGYKLNTISHSCKG